MNDPFQHLHMAPELATEFIAVFSRMEYALKSTKYAAGNEDRVIPAWDKFANDIDTDLLKIQEESLSQAIEFLLTEPPRKQVLFGEKVIFKDQIIDKKQSATQQLLLMIRTVRNNLFHGGKYLPEGEVEAGRNQRLVEASLTVLLACVRVDPEVCVSFDH